MIVKDFGKDIMQILNITEIQMDLYFHLLLHILNIQHIKGKVEYLQITVGDGGGSGGGGFR